MHQRRFSLIASICLVSVVICLVIGEVALRTIRGFRPQTKPNTFLTYNDSLGWIGIPGFNQELEYWGRSVRYNVNSWGFRDAPLTPVEKTQGKHRVMFLGDSHMENPGIESWERASEAIQKLDTTFVTYNFGISCYATDQELMVLKKFGPLIKPDVVLLFFTLNDIPCNNGDYAYGLAKPRFRVEKDRTLQLYNIPVPKRPALQSLVWWAKDHIAWGHYFYLTMRRFAFFDNWINPDELKRDKLYYNPDSLLAMANNSPPRDITRYLLKEIKAECLRQNASLMLFNVPDSYDSTVTHVKTPESQRIVTQWCSELEIKSIDLFPMFREEYLKTGKNLFIKDKMHWNALGNQLVTQIVLDSLHVLFYRDSIRVH